MENSLFLESLWGTAKPFLHKPTIYSLLRLPKRSFTLSDTRPTPSWSKTFSDSVNSPSLSYQQMHLTSQLRRGGAFSGERGSLNAVCGV